jgi:hypothetical protein
LAAGPNSKGGAYNVSFTFPATNARQVQIPVPEQECSFKPDRIIEKKKHAQSRPELRHLLPLARITVNLPATPCVYVPFPTSIAWYRASREIGWWELFRADYPDLSHRFAKASPSRHLPTYFLEKVIMVRLSEKSKGFDHRGTSITG